VTIGGATVADNTSVLDLRSTTKGFLPPRMTTAQRDAIASPAEGLVVYNTTTKSLDLRAASSWLSFGGSMTGNTMVSGWPDAIKCTASGTDFIFYFQQLGGGVVEYHRPESGSGSIQRIWYNSTTGAYSGNTNASTTDCVTGSTSISALYTSGKAFNFVGGGSASAAGSVAGAVQFNDGSDAFAADDVNLHWDNTNKRLGIGTATPTHILSLKNDQDAETYLRVENLTAGTGNASAGMVLLGETSALIIRTRSSVATSGYSRPNAVSIYTNSGGAAEGISIAARNPTGYITLHSGGSGERLRVDAAGGILIGGDGSANAAASSILDVTSTTKGFLPPRMTKAQRNAIAAPAEGLMIYQTEDKRIEWFDGTNWVSFSGTPIVVALTGTSASTAARSCKSILDDGFSTGNGTYWLDPDGSGGDAAFQTTCDMTANGGGWTQIPLTTQWSTPRLNNVSITKEVRFTDSTATSFLSWTGTLPTNSEFDASLCTSAGTRKAGNSYPPATTISSGPHATAYIGSSTDYLKPFICWTNHALNAGCNASWGGRSNFNINFNAGTYNTNNCAPNGLTALWIR